ncbi:MAG TPA: C39 family peptidase, partial [bacterium]|nr:C39 family peptidase [bacterium]
MARSTDAMKRALYRWYELTVNQGRPLNAAQVKAFQEQLAAMKPAELASRYESIMREDPINRPLYDSSGAAQFDREDREVEQAMTAGAVGVSLRPAPSGDTALASAFAADPDVQYRQDGEVATAPPAPGPRTIGGYAPADLTPNQFGDRQLSAAEAMAACGPAAAVAFARATGRNPTLREAVDLARSNRLWDANTGMYGPGAQQQLLNQMGVPARLEHSVDWSRIRAEVQRGNPVIVDTPAHYFVVTDYNPQTGQYLFGASGTAFRRGSAWMTPAQMETVAEGRARATLYLDVPATTSPAQLNAPTPNQSVLNDTAPPSGRPGPGLAAPLAQEPAPFSNDSGTFGVENPTPAAPVTPSGGGGTPLTAPVNPLMGILGGGAPAAQAASPGGQPGALTGDADRGIGGSAATSPSNPGVRPSWLPPMPETIPDITTA